MRLGGWRRPLPPTAFLAGRVLLAGSSGYHPPAPRPGWRGRSRRVSPYPKTHLSHAKTAKLRRHTLEIYRCDGRSISCVYLLAIITSMRPFKRALRISERLARPDSWRTRPGRHHQLWGAWFQRSSIATPDPSRLLPWRGHHPQFGSGRQKHEPLRPHRSGRRTRDRHSI